MWTQIHSDFVQDVLGVNMTTHFMVILVLGIVLSIALIHILMIVTYYIANPLPV